MVPRSRQAQVVLARLNMDVTQSGAYSATSVATDMRAASALHASMGIVDPGFLHMTDPISSAVDSDTDGRIKDEAEAGSPPTDSSPGALIAVDENPAGGLEEAQHHSELLEKHRLGSWRRRRIKL